MEDNAHMDTDTFGSVDEGGRIAVVSGSNGWVQASYWPPTQPASLQTS